MTRSRRVAPSLPWVSAAESRRDGHASRGIVDGGAEEWSDLSGGNVPIRVLDPALQRSVMSPRSSRKGRRTRVDARRPEARVVCVNGVRIGSSMCFHYSIHHEASSRRTRARPGRACTHTGPGSCLRTVGIKNSIDRPVRPMKSTLRAPRLSTVRASSSLGVATRVDSDADADAASIQTRTRTRRRFGERSVGVGVGVGVQRARGVDYSASESRGRVVVVD